MDLPHKPSVRWFQLLSSANFNKNLLPKGSVARESQVAVRETAERLRSHLLIEYYRDERDLIIESLERIDRAYRQRKREQSALDFDDLEEFAIQLLQSDEELRRRVQAGFDHILMDELQDTNPLQWKLMGLIRRPDSFFAVGDVNQSIFGFRYAEPELYASVSRGSRKRREGDRRVAGELSQPARNCWSRQYNLRRSGARNRSPPADERPGQISFRNRSWQSTSLSPTARIRRLQNELNRCGWRAESASWSVAFSIATSRF